MEKKKNESESFPDAAGHSARRWREESSSRQLTLYLLYPFGLISVRKFSNHRMTYIYTTSTKIGHRIKKKKRINQSIMN